LKSICPSLTILIILAAFSEGCNKPPAPFTFFATAEYDTIAAGQTLQFFDSTHNATSLAWNFGDGVTSTAHNPTHTYQDTGTYTVTFTANNRGGNNAAKSIKIRVVNFGWWSFNSMKYYLTSYSIGAVGFRGFSTLGPDSVILFSMSFADSFPTLPDSFPLAPSFVMLPGQVLIQLDLSESLNVGAYRSANPATTGAVYFTRPNGALCFASNNATEYLQGKGPPYILSFNIVLPGK
jgi:PKD repeat protein